jgi:hypothetical protein
MRHATRKEADDFLRLHHYLGGAPVSVRWAFMDDTAVATYGRCHVPKLRFFIELQRLAASPDRENPLSSFLAATLRALKKKGVAAVVTWADPASGHHGGIYQATNWHYVEPRSYNWNSHYRLPDGSIVDHRKAFAMHGTSSKKKLAVLEPTWEPFLPPMKRRYVMPLNVSIDECVERLEGRLLPYPKPDVDGHGPARIPGKYRLR